MNGEGNGDSLVLKCYDMRYSVQGKDFIMEMNLAGKFRIGGGLCGYKDPEVRGKRYCWRFRQKPDYARICLY